MQNTLLQMQLQLQLRLKLHYNGSWLVAASRLTVSMLTAAAAAAPLFAIESQLRLLRFLPRARHAPDPQQCKLKLRHQNH